MKMRALQMRTIFVCLKLTLIWKRLLRKYGGPDGLPGLYEKRIRSCFTMFTVATQDDMLIKIKNKLKAFLLKRLGDLIYYEQVRKFKFQMNYIQKRFKENVRDKGEYKITILNFKWEQIRTQIVKRLNNTEKIIKVNTIPLDVRLACLKEYVQGCRILHSVAFFQWRVKFEKSPKSQDSLEELLKGRMTLLFERKPKGK